MAGVVDLVSSSIVQPVNSNQAGRTKIHLTPFDLSLLSFNRPQRGLLFPKPDPSFHLICRLKTSLSLALDIYFPLAGRLVKTKNLEDSTVSFYVDCDDSGARFLHAETKSVSVSDILQPDGSVPCFLKHFFPGNGLRNCDGALEPLLVVQVTEMKDGVFICYCYNHLVADGVSMWDFFNTWCKICSSGGSSFNHKPLVLKGWFLEGIDYPIHIPVSETERPPPSRESSSVHTVKHWTLHFTKKNILDLKAKANSEVASNDQGISSLQAVSTHMWRLIIGHRGLSQEGETQCILAVDLRQRIDPPLEKDCFGNMVSLASAVTTVEELMDRSLGLAALQLRKLVSSQNNEKCKFFAEEWVRNVKNLKLGIGSKVVGDTIVIASSPRFEVYNKDFGWGKPIATRSGPSCSFDGKLTLFPGINEGSIDVHATLRSDVLVNLLADDVFLEHTTTA
ncbi:hypothetical protein CARUB_v10017241mg [Capsella rubella]|uniref:Transferase family protein n=1 Tax=Capsella rubella TaxID=81985 RepID=R0FPM0_9BRAS|nr:uncharacterized acetyltransferase At3g50280 [Capsella rubella]EOA24026.1 hypothetical protein CARUB_v10017241mg [Capsella rubella]